ncbi:MAG: dTMP kinase [Candidatus Muiribacterium halophilum]|uniref:Thymidylate kinase n=1 Tax=Muiribacterium halophilum TaxID=2053465 RepID=A0A2N5ZHA7_MUIH1|nr:MAG: dTMP kinase [Candidatus Muirbacterium halophilum]
MFITFEGPEGSGKSTQIKMLLERLKQEKIPYTKTFEPGGTPLGQEIRKLLLHRPEPMAERAELFLYAADRAEHVKTVIKPALERGEVVICDRYYHSTMAYQGYGRGISLELIRNIMDIAISDAEPERVFLIDVPVEEGFKRIKTSGRDKDRIESEALSFHQRLREGYLEMAQKEEERFLVLDGTRSPEEIHEKIWDEVKRCL